MLSGHRARPVNDRAITGDRLLGRGSPLLAIALLHRCLSRLVVTARRAVIAVIRRHRLIRRRRRTPQPSRRPVAGLQHLQKTSRGSATQTTTSTTTPTRTRHSSRGEPGRGRGFETGSIVARSATAAMASTRRGRTRDGPTSPSHGAGQAYGDRPRTIANWRARGTWSVFGR